MHTVVSDTYGGDTIAMKESDKGYCCYVNGSKSHTGYMDYRNAKNEYNRLERKYSGGTGKYGEGTVRDALGL